MRLIHNTGTDRVIDLVRPGLLEKSQLNCVTPTFSLFAFAELLEPLWDLEKVQLVLPSEDHDLDFLGSENDRAARNRLQNRWLALQYNWQICFELPSISICNLPGLSVRSVGYALESGLPRIDVCNTPRE